MKRNFIIGLFGLSAAALLGCPVWSGGGGETVPACGGYYGSSSGSSGGYYLCCRTSTDCPLGSTCESNYCVNDGVDGGSPGACSPGCAEHEICAVVDGGAVCIPKPDGGGTSEGGGDSNADSNTESGPPFTGCTSDAACADAGTGYLCLDGTCVAPANQCTDAQQCPSGEQCVQGGCVPSCSGSSPCPTGFSCNLSQGVCTGNSAPCGAAAEAGTCGKGTTCVDEHCVPDCSSGDAACGPGLVCVDNGCIPDQKPVFLCNKDGMQGACATGSICLHHACYIACTIDGGTDTCNTTELPVCKAVSIGSATYDVCGSDTTLGTECSPTMACTGGKICIDGFCK